MLLHALRHLKQVRNFCSAAETCIKFNVEERVANITMCNQKTRNALCLQMMENLLCHIEECGNNKQIRVIVIGAEGPMFSSGHNLKELALGREKQEEVFNLSFKLMCKMIDCPLPIIAKVDGLAAAAGCQLVAQCDLAFCTPKSTFSTPGANFGVFCSTPGVAVARCVPQKTALQMLFTGLPISSTEAESRGLVTKVCTDLEGEISNTCEAIICKSRAVIQLGKRFYYKQVESNVKKAYDMGRHVMVENLQTDDGQEGVKSFVEKRKPLWK